jgi:hypothetical protein
VIPFGSGAHGGLNVAGSFTLLEFNGGLPDLVYLDAGRGDVAVITGDDPEVSAYRDLFESLLQPAMSEDESITFIRQAAEDMSLLVAAMDSHMNPSINHYHSSNSIPPSPSV